MIRISNKLLLLFLLAFLIECQKLSVKENQERLLKCGKKMPHQSNELLTSFLPKSKSWLAQVKIVNGMTILPDFTFGSMISPRHVLTSSQVVMDENNHWIWNQVKLTTANFLRGTSNVKVPIGTLGKLKLRVYVIPRDNDTNRHSVKNAWLIGVDLDDENIKHTRALMLIELNRNRSEVEFPCLVGENAVMNLKDTVHIFGQNLDRSSEIVDHRVMEVKSLSDDARWIKVDKYKVALDRGGPMVEYKDDKVTLLGVAATPPVDDREEPETRFFDLRRVAKVICKLAGVCEASLAPNTTTDPAISGSTTTVVISDHNSTTEDPSVTVAPNNLTLATTRRTETRPRGATTTVIKIYDDDGYDDYPDFRMLEGLDFEEKNGHQHSELYFLVSMILVSVLVLF